MLYSQLIGYQKNERFSLVGIVDPGALVLSP